MTPAELSAALSRLDLSQAEAARRMGISRMAIAHWLAGRRPIPKYAEALLTAWQDLKECKELIAEWVEMFECELTRRGVPIYYQ